VCPSIQLVAEKGMGMGMVRYEPAEDSARGASGFSACSRREHAPAQGTSRGTEPASLTLSRSPHSCQSCIRRAHFWHEMHGRRMTCHGPWRLSVHPVLSSTYKADGELEGETKRFRAAEAQSASVQRGPWRFTSSIRTSASSFF
jgi:hypothetical protein